MNRKELALPHKLKVEQNMNIVKTMFNATTLTGCAASCRLQFRPDIYQRDGAGPVPVEPMALPQE